MKINIYLRTMLIAATIMRHAFEQIQYIPQYVNLVQSYPREPVESARVRRMR